MLMFGLAQMSHFRLWDIIPPEFQLAFHIYYVKYKNTLTCKRISWNLGGNDVLKKKINSYMYDTKSDHFSPKIKPYVYENRNQMQNHKIETISKLIYENGNFWSTLFFIKIIGSDTLWFPLPPSEVLSALCS